MQQLQLHFTVTVSNDDFERMVVDYLRREGMHVYVRARPARSLKNENGRPARGDGMDHPFGYDEDV